MMVNWLPGYLDQFALGMLLAAVSAYLAQTDRRPAWLWHPALPWVSWSVAAAAFVAVSNIGLSPIPLIASPTGPSLGRQALYGLFGLALVAPAVFGAQDRSLVRSLLAWRPLALVGVVSYGVYLWHESWIHVYLTLTGDRLFHIPWWHLTLVVLALSLAAAGLSYGLVERPVLRSGRRRVTGAAPERSGNALPEVTARNDAVSLLARLIGARS